MSESGDFAHLRLADGVEVHLNDTHKFKTVRLDLFVRALLRERRNTRLALVARLLERGTRSLPDMRSLNRFIDEMYGASFAADVDQLGHWQLVHLCFEVADDRFLPGGGEDLLARGVRFLREVVCRPAGSNEAFRRDYLLQEKKNLRLSIDALFNDKLAYAQRRCLGEMCSGEPLGLSHLGDARDFRGINAANLYAFHRELFASQPLELYISGRIDSGRARLLADELLGWERSKARAEEPGERAPGTGEDREIFEFQDLNQGRLVLGFRTHTHLDHADYPALLLFNALWGADSHSRLFRHLREEQGLCYHIASQLESLGGLLVVSTGIEVGDYQRMREGIAAQLEALRLGKFSGADVDMARRVLAARILALEDHRGALVRFHLRQKLGGGRLSRGALLQSLEAVDAEAIRRVAGRLHLDTSFFLHGHEVASRACA